MNSTVTATLSGQIVMEGFIDIRLPGWARRLITRSIAIVPAAIVTIWFGEKGTGQLLIFSQVILSLQLPFAIVPLVMFTADRKKMGELAAPALGNDTRGNHGSSDHRAQYQTVGGFFARQWLGSATFRPGSSRMASDVLAVRTGPYSPSYASPGPNNQDKRRAAPCYSRVQYDRGS